MESSCICAYTVSYNSTCCSRIIQWAGVTLLHKDIQSFSQTDRQRGYLHLNKHISDSFSLPLQRGLIAIDWQPWDLSLFPQIHFFKSNSFSILFYTFIWLTFSFLPSFFHPVTQKQRQNQNTVPEETSIKGGKKQKKRIISDTVADRVDRMHNICLIKIKNWGVYLQSGFLCSSGFLSKGHCNKCAI